MVYLDLYDICELLLSCSAFNINKSNPAYVLASLTCYDNRMLYLLAKHGFELNDKGNFKQTPLEYAISNYPNRIVHLIKLGARVTSHARDEYMKNVRELKYSEIDVN